jgi:hypothetical protein
MENKYSYLISGSTLMAKIDGKSYSLTSDHPQFATIRTALTLGLEGSVVIGLFDEAMAAARYMQGEVEARAGVLYYQNEPVHNTVATRILDFMARDIPYQPLVEFLKRLQKNPSKRSVEELYGFMERNALPITEDGFVLGYKGVTDDYKDCHTRTVDNRLGAKPSMERNTVDDNWQVLCSSGYHVGSQSYATGFGARTVIVKIDPADVVSVPDDGDKMRVCAYEVVSEYAGELPKAVAVSADPYREGNAVLSFLRSLFGIKQKA